MKKAMELLKITMTFKWYQKAAEKDNSDAQNSLGLFYQKGQGVEQNSHEAFKWHLKAANQRHHEYHLGLC
jgi:TPR repeat protein